MLDHAICFRARYSFLRVQQFAFSLLLPIRFPLPIFLFHSLCFIHHTLKYFPSSHPFFFPFSVRPERVELVRRDYWANGGWETFLTYEDPQQDVLIGLLRLRK